MFPANYCPQPASAPSGGKIKVHSDGHVFGRNCSTGGVFKTMAGGSGCGGPQLKLVSTADSGGNTVSEYLIR